MLTWPASKACEPHVVLMGLTALAALAVAAPPLWLVAWRLGVLALAVLAPVLALARAAKAVRRGTTKDEFDRWFRPEMDAEDPAAEGCDRVRQG